MCINRDKKFLNLLTGNDYEGTIEKGCLLHYTSAEAGVNILRSQKFWLRNAQLMNDIEELKTGAKAIAKHYFMLGYDELPTKVREIIEQSEEKWGKYTHILSLAREEKEYNEAKDGRLSMWRAYGMPYGVAFVFNQKMLCENIDHKYTIYPVLYNDENKIKTVLQNIRSADEKQEFLERLYYLVKHNGFNEENEWRIVYNSGKFRCKCSPCPMRDIVAIKGIAQEIVKLPFDLNALERIIIGPSANAENIADAYRRLVAEALLKSGNKGKLDKKDGRAKETEAISKAETMVTISSIPYRG